VLPPTDENYAQQQKLRELANPIQAPVPKKKGAAPEPKKGASAETSKGVKRSRDHDVEKVPSSDLPNLLLCGYIGSEADDGYYSKVNF
jgi:hypothetical protein